MSMRPAVLYARVSSKDQEREGFSIPAQLKLLREYALRNSFEIVHEFIDVETAKQTGRVQFGNMLAFLGVSKGMAILVEKTDRLYRNFHDLVKIEDSGVEIHFAKESRILGKDTRSSDRLAHNINAVLARHYIDNLKEEVTKGMREKAEQGIYPSRPPFGYTNNKAEHTIEVHKENSLILRRTFELWATGQFSLEKLRKQIRLETGKHFQKGYLHKLLKHPFYGGVFEWQGVRYKGTHPLIVSPELFQAVQQAFAVQSRPKYRKHNFAFSGLMTCARDGCTITAEIKKQKFTYYRCTGGRGKCRTPYMREEKVSEQLGTVLQDIYVPREIAAQIVASIRQGGNQIVAEALRHRQSLEVRLTAIRKRMDQLYVDKLDGKVDEEFWTRKNADWKTEEGEILTQLARPMPTPEQHAMTVERALELANRAYLLYSKQNPQEQAKLLKLVLSNCSVDGVSTLPSYRRPFDLIAKRAKAKEWCARRDSNSRPTDS